MEIIITPVRGFKHRWGWKQQIASISIDNGVGCAGAVFSRVLAKAIWQVCILSDQDNAWYPVLEGYSNKKISQPNDCSG
jgi:hypothetical protein